MAKIDTDPNKGTRAEGRVATGHLDRRAAVKSILDILGDDTLIVAGLAGTKGDVLAAVGDDPRVFGFGGAMGAATSMGLGLALARPDKRILVVTGDGELLMNVGTLATVAVANPSNLGIVCVDNEHYGETGFQRSHTGLGTDLAQNRAGQQRSDTATTTCLSIALTNLLATRGFFIFWHFLQATRPIRAHSLVEIATATGGGKFIGLC